MARLGGASDSVLIARILVELLLQYLMALPMTVLYLHHRHLTPGLRVFIDWLKATRNER